MARISPGTMTAAIFAILIGLGGAYTVRQYINRPAEEVVEEEPPARQFVYIPSSLNDLTRGRKLSMNDIAIQKFTPEEVRKSRFAGVAFLSNPEQIVGQVLKVDIKRGEAFLPNSFFPAGSTPGVAELLRSGYRAVTIPVHNVGAVAGFARPGSYVDILFRSVKNDHHPEMTMTLLEKVEVLAVGDVAVAGQNVKDSPSALVTLAVVPEQATALKVVEGRGELTLTLRMPGDDAEFASLSNQKKMTLGQILGSPYMTRVFAMDVFMGSNKSTLTFNEEVYVDQQTGGYISTPVAAGVPSPINNSTTLPSSPTGRTPVIESGGGESGGGESGGSGS